MDQQVRGEFTDELAEAVYIAQYERKIAELEDGGHLISVEHMDGAQIGSIEMAARPAPRCALGGRARNFEDGRSELPGRYYPIITAIRGDLSVMLDGKAIGAIGRARILCE